MEELDYFFAKKDKKKNKSKKKFTTVDTITKNFEEDLKSDKEKSINFNPKNDGKQEEDDDWVDFEEREKDYSGLKIQQLELKDEVKIDNDLPDNTENDSENKIEKLNNGPWNKFNSNTEIENVEKEVISVTTEEKTEEKTVSKPEVYIPPHVKFQKGSSTLDSGVRRTKVKQAPDIYNEEYFPSLASSAASDAILSKKELFNSECSNKQNIKNFEPVIGKHEYSRADVNS